MAVAEAPERRGKAQKTPDRTESRHLREAKNELKKASRALGGTTGSSVTEIQIREYFAAKVLVARLDNQSMSGEQLRELEQAAKLEGGGRNKAADILEVEANALRDKAFSMRENGGPSYRKVLKMSGAFYHAVRVLRPPVEDPAPKRSILRREP